MKKLLCSVLHKISGLAQAVHHWPLTKQPRFDPTPIHFGSFRVLWFYPVIFLPPVFYTHSLIYKPYTRWTQFSDVESKLSTLRTYTWITPQWNSRKFAHASPRLHMSSAKHTADVEKIIHLIPNFVQHAPSDVRHGSCDMLHQLWQRFWKRWDEHLSLNFFDYIMYKWSMFQKLAPSSVTWSNRWHWFSKESTRVGAFPDPCHLRTKQGPSSKMLCFSCTLDDGESSKQEYVWMSNNTIKTSQELDCVLHVSP